MALSNLSQSSFNSKANFYMRSQYIGPRVYHTGSLIIALVRPCVQVSFLKYLRDCSLGFSLILHEDQWNKRSYSAGILKKIFIGRLRGLSFKNLGFWVFSRYWIFFCMMLEGNRAHYLSMVGYLEKIVIRDPSGD